MLGKHHLAISVGIVLPFLIPLLLLNLDLILPITFLIAVVIGSLTPDADCGGKATLYYRFPIIDNIMKKFVIKVCYIIFNKQKIKEKMKITKEINYKHRGIMHSPIGIFISSFLLTVIFLIVVLFLESFNPLTAIVIFFGLLTGQFFHLMEDSFTVSGIDWKFPFGEKLIHGTIYTYHKVEDKRDIRPGLFAYSLGLLSLIIFLYFIFSSNIISLWLLYPIIFACVLLIVGINFFLSKSKGNFLVHANTIRSMKKIIKSLIPKYS